ncbi:MAG TPA: heterodisulfide reductase-related iron-sulfur binding cluster [Candidatus Binatia bacterium]|jgi:glycolate oxidase iron-sulfur subunit|nr:heterodisulfide reductase-related iron-sulfur binding cluster [Candidatus Binatia bacterium]
MGQHSDTVPAPRVVPTEKLLACVHCGLCLSSCPTYLELGTEADSPRGRIALMRGLEEGRLEPTAEVLRHLDLCLGCRACETACPSGVQYGALIEAARPYLERHRPAPARVARRLLATALTTPWMRRAMFAPARLVAGASWLRRLPWRWAAYGAALPRQGRRTMDAVIEPAGQARGTAVLLTGCVAETLFDGTNHATAALLRHAGVRVVVPQAQGCCGALPLHLGAHDRSVSLARRTAGVLADTGADWVVTNAAGCGALVREYDQLLPGDPDANVVARTARDALELLAELGLPAAPAVAPRTVAVHDPCHLAHGQGVRAQVRTLLEGVPGLRLVELAESDTCCGSAGTYNLTEPAMARRLLDRKLDHVAASGADVVVAANPGCLLQMRAGAIARRLPMAVEHPIDLLARAYGLV